ncbi:MAG: tyrosine--tRNA ligase [Deltaproteobacteria bacterium]|nr:tyrosine--tRNA ligase [Deltaproteobacteria bacterium]MBW2051913.1 tyrosine--tRNA ligase [Deltaproteobacteria bacterium]MBW2140973.1 tyrosine--tRNA ligase [Deltaproteobacteria bacterium]MBW2322719.1 tyrosine--tRNA ligase [Deltaproteobacteria bacterium]
MGNLYDILLERGFIYQSTDENDLRDLLDREQVKIYIGFDPTADSLHVGSLIPVMSLAWAQRTGHRPIVIVGGGTAMVGDPSGKTEMRQMISLEEIAHNQEGLKNQLSRYFTFGDDQGLMINNADWLLDLKYVEFLRDIGKHFSVNRMLAAESYRMRLETGLSFLEFNYMLLQAYDFYKLFTDYGCTLQMGGQDQWGNIVAGIDLIRRLTGQTAYGLTFPLLMTAANEKFGKTHAGAVWLDKEKTSPYDFYQFWRNTDDVDLSRFLGLFTFLPMDEVKNLEAQEGSLINRSKEILAYEATAVTHGHEAARDAYIASVKAFGQADPEGLVKTSSQIANIKLEAQADLPTTSITSEELKNYPTATDLFVFAGLTKSKSDARRLIRGGGGYINDQRVEKEDQAFTSNDLKDSALLLRAGKKRYHRILVKET